MGTKIRPFAEFLPYWATQTLPTRQGWPLPVLVMKDGTICAGFRMTSLDTFSLPATEVNRISGILVDALHVLPPDAYLQAVFETGDNYDDLVRRFAAQSHPGSDPLLKRSRQVRAQVCREQSEGQRPQITYWLGWRYALQGVNVEKKPASVSKLTLEKLTRACQALADVAEAFFDRLELAGLAGEVLTESEILADLHRAVNPSRYRESDPPFHVSDKDWQDFPGSAGMLLNSSSLASRLALAPLRVADSTLRLDDPPILQRVLGVTKYPDETRPGWPHDVMYGNTPNTPYRLVVTHLATDKILRTEELMKKSKRLFGHVGERFFAPEDLVQAAQSHIELLKEAGQSDARVFDTSVQIVVSGRDYYEIDAATRAVASAFQNTSTQLSTRFEEQLQAWQASLPANGYTLRRNILNRTHQLLSRNAAHVLPYWRPPLSAEEPDLLMQTHQKTWRGFSVRMIPGRDDASALIIGKTGSGKTFLFTLLFKLGVLDLGGHVILTDIKGPENSSYKPLCDLLGGLYICLKENASCSFNPYPTLEEVFIGGEVYSAEATKTLCQLLCMMGVPDLDTNRDRDFFAEITADVVKLTYEFHRSNSSRHLMLEDTLAAFERYKPMSDTLRGHAKDLQERLSAWCRIESRARLINRPEPMDTRNRFMVFDFAGLEEDKDLSAVLISTLSTRIWAKLAKLPRTTPKLIGLDEAWSLFGNSPAAENLIEKLFRTARSHGAFCYALTQHHKDLLGSRAGQAVKASASMLYLMRHVADHDVVGDAFGLTPRERHLFRNLQFNGGHFAEALVKDHNLGLTEVVRYSPTPFDLWCDTSRGADVELRNDHQRQSGAPLLKVVEELARRFPHGTPKSESEYDNDYIESEDALVPQRLRQGSAA